MLAELCEVKFILAYSNGETSFDRIVEKCLLPNDRDLAAEMVKTGLALDTPHFTTTDLKHMETPNFCSKLRLHLKKKE